ncbi:MAG: hypothetical protein R2699_08910 [Acidimicrobiales bacterium]
MVHAWPLELVNDRPLDPHHVGREIEAIVASVAPDLFAGFDASTFPATSLPAMALAAQAYAAGGTALGEAVSMDLRRAVFESGQDVSQPDVLDAIAAAHGIDRDDGGGSAVPPVVADDYAQGRPGVIGSPHFFVEGADWFCPVLEISQSDGSSMWRRARRRWPPSSTPASGRTPDQARDRRLVGGLIGAPDRQSGTWVLVPDPPAAKLWGACVHAST